MDHVVVRAKNLSHRYTRDWAIRDLNLEMTRSGITGLLGANGAGKSTFMNILCGALYQTQGDVYVDGLNIREHPLEAKKRIGFLPQQAPLYFELTVDEYLTHCASLRNMAAGAIGDAVAFVKEKCGLTHFSRRLINNLSGGYRQRVGIAQAIVHEPQVVVLDEPMNGLDPNQILEVRKLIKEIAQERFVILSSHILSEVQAVCSRIIMIDRGTIVFTGSMDAFNEFTEPHTIRARLENPPDTSAFLAIDGITGAQLLNGKRVLLTFEGGQDVAERIVATSVEQGWQLREIGFERSSLEETFARLSVDRADADA